MADLSAKLTDQTACVIVQSPNFFGIVEDIPAIAELAHSKGALLIVSIAEAVSLGIMRPPVEADIVSMEAQSFGVALSYGGPYCGVIASKEKFLRQMPGRLCGETKDSEGRRGFVLTLSTREQHIRREKATSNICTNQALVALMATIFLTVYGKEGDSRTRAAESCQGSLRGRRSQQCFRRQAVVCGFAPFSRICAADRRDSGRSQRSAAGAENHRRTVVEEVVSRTGQRDIVVCYRTNEARRH